jgi:hypothetical protein
MFAHVVLYDMHSRFFANVLDKISDEDAHKRLDTKANHVAWLAGSLVEQRYWIANLLGVPGQQEAKELFDHNKGIQDGITYPPLAQFKRDWEAVTPSLREAMVSVTDEKLGETFEMMPGVKMSNFEMTSFFIYREANCIGQIALWRRLLGYDAMKYM